MFCLSCFIWPFAVAIDGHRWCLTFLDMRFSRVEDFLFWIAFIQVDFIGLNRLLWWYSIVSAIFVQQQTKLLCCWMFSFRFMFQSFVRVSLFPSSNVLMSISCCFFYMGNVIQNSAFIFRKYGYFVIIAEVTHGKWWFLNIRKHKGL